MFLFLFFKDLIFKLVLGKLICQFSGFYLKNFCSIRLMILLKIVLARRPFIFCAAINITVLIACTRCVGGPSLAGSEIFSPEHLDNIAPLYKSKSLVVLLPVGSFEVGKIFLQGLKEGEFVNVLVGPKINKIGASPDVYIEYKKVDFQNFFASSSYLYTESELSFYCKGLKGKEVWAPVDFILSPKVLNSTKLPDFY